MKLKNREVGCEGSEQETFCTVKRGSLNTLRTFLKVKVYLIIKVANTIVLILIKGGNNDVKKKVFNRDFINCILFNIYTSITKQHTLGL